MDANGGANGNGAGELGAAMLGSTVIGGGGGSSGGALLGACSSDDDSWFCNIMRFASTVQSMLYVLMVALLVYMLFHFVRGGGLGKLGRMARNFAQTSPQRRNSKA